MAPPIIDVKNTTPFLNTSIAASDLFDVTAADSEVVAYYFQDFSLSPSSGQFFFNGIAVPHNQFYEVAADDLNLLTYRAGTQVGREKVRVMARNADGQWSDPQAINTQFTVRANVTAPYVRAISFSVLANEAAAGADFTWGFDPDGHPIQSFRIRDRSIDMGYFEVDGIAKTQGQFFTVNVADIKKLKYRSFGSDATELFDVFSHDGAQESNRSVGFATTVVNANRPEVRFSRTFMDGNEVLNLAGQANISDPDGNSIKKYRFLNQSIIPADGELVFKGIRQPRTQWIQVDASDLEFINFVPANQDGSQNILVRAFDGRYWSTENTLNVRVRKVGNPDGTIIAPDYKPNVLEHISEQLIDVDIDSLFTKLDAGTPYTSYKFYDPDPNPASGRFNRSGIPLASGVIHTESAPVFENQVTFRTGAFFNRTLDTVYVQASNEFAAGQWERVDIRNEPEYLDVLAAGSWTGLLPRNIEGDLIVTYSFMQQFPNYNTGEARDGNPLLGEHFSIFTATQRENLRLIFDHVESLANVQMVEVQDTSTNVFGGTGGIVRMGEYGIPSPGSSAAAFAFFPGFGDAPGDMWFNRLNGGAGDFNSGSFGWKVVLHEFGHAMGLKHPHDGTPRLPPETDVNDFSVMSYQPAENGEPTTYQLYDIESLQRIYGANLDTRTGDNLYSIADYWGGNDAITETIWDAGGVDTLSAVGSVNDAIVDLRSGQQSSIGRIPRNITVAFNAVVENGIGSSNNDRLFGNAANNLLEGRAGNDYLRGNDGNDLLKGGAGNDIYEFGVADGINVIDEESLFGDDTLRITRFAGLDRLEQDFQFRMSGSDLVVDLTLNDGPSQGLARIQNQTSAGSQIETLELNGVRIDLANLTMQITPTDRKFEVLTAESANGFLVQPI